MNAQKSSTLRTKKRAAEIVAVSSSGVAVCYSVLHDEQTAHRDAQVS